MARFVVAHPLDHFFEYDTRSNGKGVVVEVNSADHAIVQLFAAEGKVAAVERSLKIRQSPGQATLGKNYTAVPLSPGQWMLVSSGAAGPEFAKELDGKIGKNGYVSEQSDSRVIFSLSGPRVRELMQKGCRLDLHPSVTGKGWCAQTQIAQCGVILLQTDNTPAYDLLVYSGFAQHFAEWLQHTGAQLGISFSR